ncbi:hypothetical protein [Acinetobacter sp. MD2(2019)]|uniref:hypothetical protein n=1 Tax=Acinetobacter sp. MD2(2019) TaxID=2605273 RepID=UPI002D1F95BB|nr:hypothetical protein [Acinetobacter sp. MD2(2019)]MEB3754889.1 hypothetical protein [Acinetobacter sp. MD2(2019)]
MAKRTSFHITEQSEKIVAENGDQAKRINFLIAVADALQESPVLSYGEWMVVCAAANGFDTKYSAGLDSILYSFATGIPYAAIFGDEFDAIDKKDVAQKFYALPKNQQVFAFELARKFWLPKDKPVSSYLDWLQENGANIK